MGSHLNSVPTHRGHSLDEKITIAELASRLADKLAGGERWASCLVESQCT